MAVDSVQKRASSVGCYWPYATVDRPASLDQYSWTPVGPYVEPPGVPELRTLTVHRSDSGYTIGRTGAGYTTRRR